MPLQKFQNWTRTSIRTRLTLWIVGILALILIVPVGIFRYGLETTLLNSIDQELKDRGRGMAGIWDRRAPDRSLFPRPEPGHGRDAFGIPAPNSMEQPSLSLSRPRLFDLNGRALPPFTRDVLWDRGAFERARMGNAVLTTIRLQGEPTRVYSLPLRRNGVVVYVMQTAYSLAEMERDIRALGQMLVALIPIALLLVGFGAAILTDRLLRPIRTMTRTVEQIRASDLSQRLPISGSDEFSRLSVTLNDMLARLEQAFEQQRRFTADASHELRSPLSAIKTHTSFALYGERTPADYRRALEGADRSVDRMSRIVHDLLLLARSDSGQLQPVVSSIPVQEILETAIENLQGWEHAPIETQFGAPNLRVTGEKGHLIRLFTNLLSNAAQHTPQTGQITVSAHSQGGAISICVDDTGSGIAPEHLPHVFERFYRADEARNHNQGSIGLGLAICKCIVEAHHGQITLTSELHQGTTVEVLLPAAPPTQ